MLKAVLRGRKCFVQVPSSTTSCLGPWKLLHSSSCLFKSTLEEVKEKERSITPKAKKAKLKMDPFVKNLFYGVIDPNIFAYPELDQGSLNIALEMKEEIEKCMRADSSLSNSEEKISSGTLSKLKELGLFKLNIPQQYGGLESTCTEIILLSEALSKNPSLFHTLNVHLHYISNLFTMYANDEQKERYLPALASGDLHIGFAAWEKNAGIDLSNMETTVSFRGDSFVLNGTKHWVCNGGIADKFVVFAKELEGGKQSVSCFLVDKNSDGITAKSMDTLGLQGFNAWELEFKKTVIPKENLIGASGQGLSILTSLLNGKFTLAGANIGLLRDLIDQTALHAIKRETFGKPLIEHDIVKQHLAEASARLYALESITYMTADLYDNIEDPDLTVEAAIVKVYSCETTMWIVQKCLSILGSNSYLKDHPYELILRDVLFTPLVDSSADALRMTIALLCLQHVGHSYQDIVLKRRNPLHHPTDSLKALWDRAFQSEEKVAGFKGVIYENVHPTLEISAALIEKSILRMFRIIEDVLVTWGSEIDHRQMLHARIADCAIDLYVATAVIARASRSMSIGLRNCDTDRVLSNAISLEVFERVKLNLESIMNSPYSNTDASYSEMAKFIVHEKKYPFAHPLTRNY